MKKHVVGGLVAGFLGSKLLDEIYNKAKILLSEKSTASNSSQSFDDEISNLTSNLQHFAKGYVIGGAAWSAMLIALLEAQFPGDEKRQEEAMDRTWQKVTADRGEYLDIVENRITSMGKILEKQIDDMWPLKNYPIRLNMSDEIEEIRKAAKNL